jgi:subtilisin family serine protease
MKSLQIRFTGLAALAGVLIFLTACHRLEPVDMIPGSGGTAVNRQQPTSFSSGTAIEGQYIVTFKENSDLDDHFRMLKSRNYEAYQEASDKASRKLVARNKVPESAILKSFGSPKLKGMVVRLERDQLQKIQNDPSVDLIEQDQVFALSVEPMIRPPLTPTSGGTTMGQIPSWGFGRVGGTSPITSAPKAWIIDSGIDLDHPDLNVNTVKSKNFCTQGTYSANGNDGLGHGTHVAGIIGAKDNQIGTIGIVPGVSLVSVKVLSDEGYGKISDVIFGVIYVMFNAQPQDVVNVSLGGVYSPFLDLMVACAVSISGAPVVVASGNSSQSVSLSSPARINLPNVYVVASVGDDDSFSSFSNYGSTVDYAAPGENILSTYKDGQYATLTGTSMAAPHVAGVVLLTGNNPTSSGYALNPPDNNVYPIIFY